MCGANAERLLCDRVTVMGGAQIVEQGLREDVLKTQRAHCVSAPLATVLRGQRALQPEDADSRVAKGAGSAWQRCA
jgi:ABC-type dipeptide/oligopeptide/nickel transport system ATPase component